MDPHSHINVRWTSSETHSSILTLPALDFIYQLSCEFRNGLLSLLGARIEAQSRTDSRIAMGVPLTPTFDRETEPIRNNSAWKVNPPPSDLTRRWVEITGPASSRKMVINALNSGAHVYMADAEDSESPTWKNILDGQMNIRDAVRRTISLETPQKRYALNEKTATLMFRPRGLHLVEGNFFTANYPVPASLFDAGMFLFHNARELLNRGATPYLYLPKLEHYLEARWWNEVLVAAEEKLGIPRNSVRVTVLIETLPAAFQMDEILFELQERILGLNCGRWDYIFSFIKKLRNDPRFVLPDRRLLTMDTHFLSSYAKLLVATCHKRGAYAMGGMAAQIPVKNDPEANETALQKVRTDKLREVSLGHDGTWVAHPDLVPLAMEIFEKHMSGDTQIANYIKGETITEADLLRVPEGEITLEGGVKSNLKVGSEYLSAWISGNGCVPINNLMEDAATAEISRAQLWQWIKHGVKTREGVPVTKRLLEAYSNNDLFLDCATGEKFPEFLTSFSYEQLFDPSYRDLLRSFR